MKKLLCLFMISGMLLPQAVFADPMQSTNSFEIDVQEIPPGGGGGGGGGGLSNGAVTAITLGSIFGGLGLLGGVGYYFAKHKSELKTGAACGLNNPYSTICISDTCALEKLKIGAINNKHLLRALDLVLAKNCNCTKFLLIPDSKITNGTYNTVFFNLPEFAAKSPINVRIIQVSAPFSMNGKMPSLDTKILINAKEKNVQEIATIVDKNQSTVGILEKKGQITDCSNKVASINTYYNSDEKNSCPQVYALIVEFNQF